MALQETIGSPADARRFFESHFTPCRIETGEEPSAFLTGYYEPVVSGSLVRTEAFTEPVFARPADLDQLSPYPTRAEIEAMGQARFQPLVWLADAIEVFMIQVQLEQIARALTYMRTKSRSTLELRPEVEAASYAELQRRVASTVWASGCSSWYVSETGQVDTIWPGTTTEYWWRARRFHPDRYVTTAGRFGEITPAR
jgi:hypothetical protein